VKEKDKAKAKRLESVKVTKTKEDLVTVRTNVATQAGTAYDLYCKLLANDTEAHHFLKLVIYATNFLDMLLCLCRQHLFP
jgi:hypothetical protein